MPIDPADPRPAYEQIAAELRQAIESGELAPGDRLPRERELTERYGVAPMTARQAVGVLRNAGLVDSQQGKGAFVRVTPEGRRLAFERYQVELDQLAARAAGRDVAPATSFTRDHDVAWSDYRLDKEFAETPAPAAVAELLGVAPGTPLLERRFTFWAGERPQQRSVSYLPLALVAGTPVADPDNEPWPGGNIAQLATLGVTVSRVHETVRARMPTPEEVEALHIAPGVPVLAITRVMLAGPGRDHPVEAAADIVIPADRVALDYTVDLEPPGA